MVGYRRVSDSRKEQDSDEGALREEKTLGEGPPEPDAGRRMARR